MAYQCRHPFRKIINTRKRQRPLGHLVAAVYRRYECQDPRCLVRWSTYEISEKDFRKVVTRLAPSRRNPQPLEHALR